MSDAEARFWAKVNTAGDCWLWTASVDGNGYGRFRTGNVEYKAHVWAWENEHGPRDRTLDLDHLCSVRACVRPSHLEPVTHRENLLRGPTTLTAKAAAATHCPSGHPYDAENTYVTKQGYRGCLICKRDAARRMTIARRKANRVAGQRPSIKRSAAATTPAGVPSAGDLDTGVTAPLSGPRCSCGKPFPEDGGREGVCECCSGCAYVTAGIAR